MKDGLAGLDVVYFESRLGKTMGDLIRLNGGNAIAAPAMKEVPLENNRQVFSFVEKLLKDEIDFLILLTGVGAKTLMDVMTTRYSRENIIESLKKVCIVPRGPKPIRVLNEWGVPYALTVPEPNTWKEIVEALDSHREVFPIEKKVVAIQEYGIPNQELIGAFKQRKAIVEIVPVYRWALPDDTEPLKSAIRLLIQGKVNVALFTTSVQVDHLFQIASSLGVESELNQAFKKCVVASVGPDCSQTIRSYGLLVDIEPLSPKMGPLVQMVNQKSREIFEQKNKSS